MALLREGCLAQGSGTEYTECELRVELGRQRAALWVECPAHHVSRTSDLVTA